MPPEERRPLVRQRWETLLFLHWPMDAGRLRELLPAGLDVDTFDGTGWVSLVPFTMKGTRPWWGPAIPGFSNCHEVNLRTYVRRGDREPGVWFFSLDASHVLAPPFARAYYHLPYFLASMDLTRDGADVVFRSERRGARPPARCHVRWRAEGEPRHAPAGSLDHFLAERYVLYAAGGDRLFRARVRHAPYPLREARFRGLDESLSRAAHLTVTGDPLLAHAVDGVDVEIFGPERAC